MSNFQQMTEFVNKVENLDKEEIVRELEKVTKSELEAIAKGMYGRNWKLQIKVLEDFGKAIYWKIHKGDSWR